MNCESLKIIYISAANKKTHTTSSALEGYQVDVHPRNLTYQKWPYSNGVHLFHPAHHRPFWGAKRGPSPSVSPPFWEWLPCSRFDSGDVPNFPSNTCDFTPEPPAPLDHSSEVNYLATSPGKLTCFSHISSRGNTVEKQGFSYYQNAGDVFFLSSLRNVTSKKKVVIKSNKKQPKRMHCCFREIPQKCPIHLIVWSQKKNIGNGMTPEKIARNCPVPSGEYIHHCCWVYRLVPPESDKIHAVFSLFWVD